MDVLHDRCAGLDIGKKDLKACVRTPSLTSRRSRRQEIRTYATTTNALLELRDWLVEQQVTLVVLEATGAEMLLDAARTMGDALVERAIRDHGGAYWRFLEHRQDPPLLPPGTSWMQGAAGIAGYLLRLARVVQDGRSAPVVDSPDQWWAVPTHLRIGHTTG